jgi:hypothetical protein
LWSVGNHWSVSDDFLIVCKEKTGQRDLVSTPVADPGTRLPKNDLHQSRWLVLVELLLIALIFLSESIHLIPTFLVVFGHLIPLGKVPFLVLLGWISLRLRGLRWREVGLAKKRSWLRILALGTSPPLRSKPSTCS